jgi:uncharacterized protein
MIITAREANIILHSSGIFEVSLDLGISISKGTREDGFVQIEGQKIPVESFEKVKEKFCYLIEDNELKKIALFSDETNYYYKLYPTEDWPTFMISATPMHRYTHISPKEDTYTKIKEICPVKGKILDTCCGLGYTAILASHNAESVYTFEWDPNVITIARLNPHSRELFTCRKIILSEKNILEEIEMFKPNFFDRILHDPPTFSRSPELFSPEFYAELFRILKPAGILYHYSPMPHKTQGKLFYESIIKKLVKAGFSKAEYHPESSGIRAEKP